MLSPKRKGTEDTKLTYSSCVTTLAWKPKWTFSFPDGCNDQGDGGVTPSSELWFLLYLTIITIWMLSTYPFTGTPHPYLQLTETKLNIFHLLPLQPIRYWDVNLIYIQPPSLTCLSPGFSMAYQMLELVILLPGGQGSLAWDWDTSLCFY